MCRSMGDIKPPGQQFWATRSLGAEKQQNVRDLAESLNKVGVLRDADLDFFKGQTVEEEEVHRALGTIDNAVRQWRMTDNHWYLGSLQQILTYYKESCPPGTDAYKQLEDGIQKLVTTRRETESPLDKLARKKAEAAAAAEAQAQAKKTEPIVK